jgi:hypothetical protein
MKMMINGIFGDHSTKRNCVEDKQKRTNNGTLKNIIINEAEEQKAESLLPEQRTTKKGEKMQSTYKKCLRQPTKHVERQDRMINCVKSGSRIKRTRPTISYLPVKANNYNCWHIVAQIIYDHAQQGKQFLCIIEFGVCSLQGIYNLTIRSG